MSYIVGNVQFISVSSQLCGNCTQLHATAIVYSSQLTICASVHLDCPVLTGNMMCPTIGNVQFAPHVLSVQDMCKVHQPQRKVHSIHLYPKLAICICPARVLCYQQLRKCDIFPSEIYSLYQVNFPQVRYVSPIHTAYNYCFKQLRNYTLY